MPDSSPPVYGPAQESVRPSAVAPPHARLCAPPSRCSGGGTRSEMGSVRPVALRRDSIAAGMSLDAFTQQYKDAFFEDVDKLRIERAEAYRGLRGMLGVETTRLEQQLGPEFLERVGG